MIITIDGPAAAGKGTVSKVLAEKYKLAYFDTWMIYRAVGLDMVLKGLNPENEEKALEVAKEMTFEKMMELFWDKIKELANQWTNFVSDGERNAMIDKSKNKIFDKLKDGLLKNEWVKEENTEGDNGGNEKINDGTTYEFGKTDFRIKLNGLKDKIKELGFYDGNEEWDTIKFNISKVKEYLINIQWESWRKLQSQEPLKKATWITAVQIALNYLWEKENKSSYNVKLIDWIRKDKTIAWVRWFQEDNWLVWSNGKGDGKPWPKTIEKILEKLW